MISFHFLPLSDVVYSLGVRRAHRFRLIENNETESLLLSFSHSPSLPFAPQHKGVFYYTFYSQTSKDKKSKTLPFKPFSANMALYSG
jgi:hypothetical protein